VEAGLVNSSSVSLAPLEVCASDCGKTYDFAYTTDWIDPREDPGWRSLAESAQGSLFVSPPWIEAICAAYGFKPEGWVVRDRSGRAIGGAAIVDVEDIRGRRLVSLPFCDRADPFAPSPEAWNPLAECLVQAAANRGAALTLRMLGEGLASTDPRFNTVAEDYWHATSLERPIDKLFEGLNLHARRNIGVAQRRGVSVVADRSIDAVRAMHRFQVKLRREKYGLLAQPLEFFEAIWAKFAPFDGIVTMLAFHGDAPIAAALYLVWGDTLYYKFGASLQQHLSLRPNEAIAWEALRWGSERGLRKLDWGLSAQNQPGLVAYKRKWATEERRLVTRRISHTAFSRSQVVAQKTLLELTELLTDRSVSDEVCAKAGAILYRYFA
jgi:CelD/BcsL family acetyltransferase involved in cellulose biosynthesis